LKSDQEWGHTFTIAFGSLSEVGLDQVSLYLFRATNSNRKTITASIRESWNGSSVWESTIDANSIQNDSSANPNSLHDPVIFYGSTAQLSTGTEYYLRLDTTASDKIYMRFDVSFSDSPGGAGWTPGPNNPPAYMSSSSYTPNAFPDPLFSRFFRRIQLAKRYFEAGGTRGRNDKT